MCVAKTSFLCVRMHAVLVSLQAAGTGPALGPAPASTTSVIARVVATSSSMLVLTFAEEYNGNDIAAADCSAITVSYGRHLGTAPTCSALIHGTLTWTITLGSNPTIIGGMPTHVHTCQWHSTGMHA